MTTELAELKRIANQLGLKATGDKHDLIRRIGRHWHMPASEVKEYVQRRLARLAKHKKPLAKKLDFDDYGYGRDYNRDYDYDYAYKRRGRRRSPSPYRRAISDNEAILETCGEQCFADDALRVPICPRCDEDKCHCRPTCRLLRQAYEAGHDKPRMEALSDDFNCKDFPKEAVFREGDLLVSVVKGMPVFGRVTKVKRDAVTVATLSLSHAELRMIIQQFHDDGYTFTAKELFDAAEGKFFVEPDYTAKGGKTFKVDRDGHSKELRARFIAYAGETVYLRKYTVAEMEQVMEQVMNVYNL